MTTEKTCIVLTFDANMALPAAVLINSIIENYFDFDNLDIVCGFMGSVKETEYLKKLINNIKKDSRINIKIIEIESKKFKWIEKLKNISTRHHAPPLIDLCKLFLGSILADYDKAIYFDTDMLVVRNIQPILEHPMHNKLMAIVDISGPEFYYLKSKGEAAHINTGLMIIDLNWWRDSKLEEMFLSYLEQTKIVSMSAEELINKYAKSSWSPLPYSFNFFQFTRDIYGIPDYDESNIIPQHYSHAIVFHFVGAAKPWNYKEMVHREDESLLGEKWRRLAKKISPGISLND